MENNTAVNTYETLKAEIQPDYADDYEGAVVVSLRRDDGVEGDVWVAAGVPPSLRSTADACGHFSGLESVRMWGDCLDDWCPEQFQAAEVRREDESEDAFRDRTRDHYDEILTACTDAAMRAWHDGTWAN